MFKLNKIVFSFLLWSCFSFAGVARVQEADSLISSNHTKTYSLPSASDTLIGRDSTDTLTNKSLSGSSNTFTNISLTSAVTNTLPSGNGGTGVASPTAHQVPIAEGSSAFTFISPSTSGFVLTSNGTGSDPSFQSAGSGTAPNSYVYVNTCSGYGSTNNKIRRFTNSVASAGSDITYADSATLGSTFTINTTGVYAVSHSDDSSAGGRQFGISVNSNQLTTSVGSITAANRLAYAISPAASSPGNLSVTYHFSATDVIRAHSGGAMDATAAEECYFIVTRVF